MRKTGELPGQRGWAAEFLHMSETWRSCLYTLAMLAFFATGWHCGLEFSLPFTITSCSFLQHCCIVTVLLSLFLWLFIYVRQSINLPMVFSNDCTAAPNCLTLEKYEAAHDLLLLLHLPSSQGGHWTRWELWAHGKPDQGLSSLYCSRNRRDKKTEKNPKQNKKKTQTKHMKKKEEPKSQSRGRG